MNKERYEFIRGIQTAIEIMKLRRPDKTLAEDLVFYGDDSAVTEAEAREVAEDAKEKAA
jgi:hypothetical protein